MRKQPGSPKQGPRKQKPKTYEEALEEENARLQREVARLTARVRGFERVVSNGARTAKLLPMILQGQ